MDAINSNNRYMDVITLDPTNQGSFLGPIASQYSYRPALRKIVDELYLAATRSTNRYFVLDGAIKQEWRAELHEDWNGPRRSKDWLQAK